MKKHPYPPSQSISRVSVDCTLGLSTGLISGKPLANSLDRPLESETHNSPILLKPSIVKCCF
jgi:hypothetical protein